jgi:acetyl esterase/lipase
MWNEPFLYEPLDAQPEQIKPNALILGYALIDLQLVNNTPVVIEHLGPEPLRLRDIVNATLLGEPDQTLFERYRADLHVSLATPPTFIWHTAGDELVSTHNALHFATALADHKVPYELHIFAGGEHGMSLADETTAVGERFLDPYYQIWIDLALRWLKRQREQQRS